MSSGIYYLHIRGYGYPSGLNRVGDLGQRQVFEIKMQDEPSVYLEVFRPW